MSGSTNFYLKTPPYSLQQGDICFAPIVRLESDPPQVGHRWAAIDEYDLSISENGKSTSALSAKVGYGPVMVISHDCQMDKEMNSHYQKLRNNNPRLSKADAIGKAEENPNLDRFITVVPILLMSEFHTDAAQIKSGETIGSFYVPPLLSGEITHDSLADLAYAATIDRNLLEDRVASLSENARGRLRLALARLYALRTPEIGFEIEQAVGQKIMSIHRDPSSPAEVVFDLQDGTEMRLILKPEASKQSRPSVRAPKKK